MSGEELSQAEIEKLLMAAGRGANSDTTQQQNVSELAAAQSGGQGAEDGGSLSQDEIEKLLQHAGRGPTTPPKSQEATPATEKSENQPQAEIHPSDLDYLFRQAEQALASLESDAASALPPGVSPFEFTEFTGAPPSTQAATLDLLKEVELDVRIELGKTRMYLEDVLRLRKGTVVTLDKLAGDPVDIYVNGRLVARGEVLVLNDNFCIRVAELVAGKDPQVKSDV
ncbi:MAG: flagellar motor switch protein FliN [Thermogutta sp.]